LQHLAFEGTVAQRRSRQADQIDNPVVLVPIF
jgi:hypothetical protein